PGGFPNQDQYTRRRTGYFLVVQPQRPATGCAAIDSTRENRRQEEFNNRVAQVKRPGDRRSVEWLCRRGGRRLQVCWPAGAGGWGGGGSGCWRVGRKAVCGRRERAATPAFAGAGSE